MNRSKSRVVVPLTSMSIDSATELALALCEGYGADLYLLDPLLVPEQTPLDRPEERLERERETAGEVLSVLQSGDHGVSVSGSVRVGHQLESLVINAASEHAADLVVLDADVFLEAFGMKRSGVERIARRVPCDVLVVSGLDSLADVRTVLVPIAGGPHSELIVGVARALATARDVWVDVLHVLPSTAPIEGRDAAERLIDEAVAAVDSERADRWLLEADDAAAAIIEESEQYDLTILGTPDRSRLKRFLFGSTTDTVVTEASVPVIVAWRNPEQPR